MEKQKILYLSLKEEYESRSIPYMKLLQTLEWSECREYIVSRDKNRCRKCYNSESEAKIENGWFLNIRAQIITHPFYGVVDEVDEWYCSSRQYHLQVHHKYYILGKLPWEYPEDALLTLCNWCHQEVHDTTQIPYYSHTGEALNYTPCHRCSGSGSFPEYSHVQSGICFRCNGARYDELIGE